jgi:hypothetical protein
MTKPEKIRLDVTRIDMTRFDITWPDRVFNSRSAFTLLSNKTA